MTSSAPNMLFTRPAWANQTGSKDARASHALADPDRVIPHRDSPDAAESDGADRAVACLEERGLGLAPLSPLEDDRSDVDRQLAEPAVHSSRSSSSARLSNAERIAVVDARARAAELLERLLADRVLLDARLSSVGRIDPMKSVRGASSLEQAIATTRDMLDAYDAMLG